MKPAPLSYARCDAVADAARRLAVEPEARLIAGGQSLGPMLNLRLAAPDWVVDISRIADLRTAALEGDRLRIGACVTHAAIEDGKIPDVTRGLMPLVARGIAYRAVRNRGTIGGSLAHADPAADWVTTMIAVDASVRLQGASGLRELKVVDFIKGPLDTALAPGEILTAVLVPRFSAEARWGRAKYAKKPGDFAQSMAIAVRDAPRGLARVVLARRAEAPLILRNTSSRLAAEAGAAAADSLAAADEQDLREAQVEAADHAMHRAIILRAVQGLSA